MSKDLTITPVISEKTYALFQSRNTYVFHVPADANKLSVLRAVKEQFDVSPVSVNILNQLGKTKRTMSLTGKRYLNSNGKRSDIKKAYVRLTEGQTLPFFESAEEAEEKRQKTQERFDEAMKKQADKDMKATKSAPIKRLRRTKTPEGK
jgi:large subunit ribosomal protein L23